MRRRVAELAELAGWTLVLALAWVATLSTPTRAEVLAGVACAAICAAVAVAARRALRLAWSCQPRWLGWPIILVRTVPADTVRLFVGVLPRLLRDRHDGGRLDTLPSPPAEPAARAAFRRAWGTLVQSTAPGTVVLTWPHRTGGPVVHRLGAGRSSLDRMVTR